MDINDACPESAANQNHDERPAAAAWESSQFDAAVVTMSAERELMNAHMAELLAGMDGAYRQLVDARADLMVASVHNDADVVAAAKNYVDEVTAMFERVSTVNVAKMTATIEQGLRNLEAAIALIPPAVEAPPTDRDQTGRDEEVGTLPRSP